LEDSLNSNGGNVDGPIKTCPQSYLRGRKSYFLGGIKSATTQISVLSRRGSLTVWGDVAAKGGGKGTEYRS